MGKQEVKVGINLHNRFDFEVRNLPKWYLAVPGPLRAPLRRVLDRLPSRAPWLWGTPGEPAMAENVVLNQGMTKILNYAVAGTASTYASLMFGYSATTTNTIAFGGAVALGSGTTAPAATQTALVTPVRNVICARDAANCTCSTDQLTGQSAQVATIDAGVGTGEVYREVGLLSRTGASSYGTLSTRALIVDGDGNPVTITKGALQVVTVTAIVYFSITHGYGPNLVFPGTASVAPTTNSTNLLTGMFLVDSSAYGSITALTLYAGSSGQQPAQTDAPPSSNTRGCVALLASHSAGTSMTRTVNAGARTITYACRIPSTVSGTIRELAAVGYAPASTDYALFRLIFPIGDNAPDYNDVVAASSIAKTSTNVVDVSFVLQFGSV